MSLAKRIYIHFLIFLLIYVEFGYQMVVTAALPGRIRMLMILAAILPLLFKMKSIKISSIVFIFYLFILILINLVRDGSFEDSILLLIPIFIGFVIANSIKFLELIKAFKTVVLFLASYSLITFCISLLFPNVISSLPYLGRVYESQATMHNAFFSVCIYNSAIVRNYGITWEPGAFSILLCLALYCLLAFEDKLSKTKIIIVITAIVTTFSTMGYFVMAGILLAFMFKRKDKNVKARKLVVAVIVSFLILLIVLPSSITNVVFGKLSGLFSEGKGIDYTTQARLNAIKYPFLAFWSSPIIGVGYSEFSIINKTLCDGVAVNTILNWFAAMGMLLGVPCTFAYIKFVLQNAKYAQMSLLSKIILVVSAILLVSTESLLRISLIYILIFYAVKKELNI